MKSSAKENYNKRFDKPTLIEAAHFKTPKDKEVIQKIIEAPELERQQKLQQEIERKQDNIRKDLEHYNQEDKKIRTVDRIKEIYAKSQKVRGKK